MYLARLSLKQWYTGVRWKITDRDGTIRSQFKFKRRNIKKSSAVLTAAYLSYTWKSTGGKMITHYDILKMGELGT